MSPSGGSLRPWRDVARRLCLQRRVLTVAEVHRRRRDGVEDDFVILESPEWVNVVALTPRNEVVLIRQWRHGIGEVALEIPGGMVDPGESPAQAAVRELSEETGYRAPHWEPLAWVHPNPALFTNRCHTFLARNAVPADAPHPDPHEEIEVLTLPLDELPALVRRGDISHSLVVSALCHLWLRLGWPLVPEEDLL